MFKKVRLGNDIRKTPNLHKLKLKFDYFSVTIPNGISNAKQQIYSKIGSCKYPGPTEQKPTKTHQIYYYLFMKAGAYKAFFGNCLPRIIIVQNLNHFTGNFDKI